jgi:hypothetical protein
MADWRQIKARIRKAKAAADAPGALENLYQRTRDAMVAFELASVLEKAERRDDAVKWFRTSFERFRRGTWKRKAGEGLVRLGEEVDLSAIPEEAAHPSGAGKVAEVPSRGFEETAVPLGDVEPEALASEPATAGDLEATAADAAGVDVSASGVGEAQAPAPGTGKKRRRGRRGGRGRRRSKDGGGRAPDPASPVVTLPSRAARPEAVRRPAAPEPTPMAAADAVGSAYAERSGRAGDPGMASRLAKLEAQLRRLLACPAHTMDALDGAPAGPGVFVLSESDQTSYYYVEACRTLSIAIGQIARGRSSTGTIKSLLAEHLGISEAKVGAYIKQHCVVRWLQLDEDAAKLAHFAIAVLRPALNE